MCAEMLLCWKKDSLLKSLRNSFSLKHVRVSAAGGTFCWRASVVPFHCHSSHTWMRQKKSQNSTCTLSKTRKVVTANSTKGLDIQLRSNTEHCSFISVYLIISALQLKNNFPHAFLSFMWLLWTRIRPFGSPSRSLHVQSFSADMPVTMNYLWFRQCTKKTHLLLCLHCLCEKQKLLVNNTAVSEHTQLETLFQDGLCATAHTCSSWLTALRCT